jgi:cyclic beta-1,2-glucan synthetase
LNNPLDVSFNSTFLRESALGLAKIHKVSTGASKPRLIRPILDSSKELLTETYRTLSSIVKSDREISPASEWILDNFYVIQEQMVQIRIDFPTNYHKNIPILSKGDHVGFPKVYEIVLNLLTHTDNVLDKEVLAEYLKSYQDELPLQIGELWGVPIMIRLFLIQVLSEKACTILEQRKVKIEVDEFVATIRTEDPDEPGVYSQAISGWYRKNSKIAGLSVLVELYSTLHAQGLLHEEQNRWFKYQFSKFEISLEDAMRQEAQKQSRLEVNVQNAVLSLRQVSEVDWSVFVEDCSLVNDVLNKDPSGDYQHMAFQTRDSYRKVIEKLSRCSKTTELDVARMALELAMQQAASALGGSESPIVANRCFKQHIGYFLVADGYNELSKRIDCVVSIRERIIRTLETRFSLYIGSVTLLMLFFIGGLWLASGAVHHGYDIRTLVALVAIFPALDLAISVVNRFFASFLPPRLLPRLNDEPDLTDNLRTLVVLPTLFVSRRDALEQIDKLEVHYLGNPDPGLQFALLSDFTDATTQSMDEDKEILDAATEAINQLNRKYPSRFGDRFFLLHRERRWNASENAWMGWERKRGKLEELNRLICEPTSPTSYTVMVGDFMTTICCCRIQFVITLDADTKLPPGSAKKLVNTIAHPLNRARYDVEKKQFSGGYTIVQPRISFSPESEKNTRFSKIFSGNIGLDPYSAAVSDIYQDLTGEASYTGKGIYDVGALHHLLDGQFPENRILSHDLIESAYVRTGLATDIELFDDYPSTYSAFTKRNHRWTRGDWQIAAWLLPHVPAERGAVKNPISLLSKWKIFDNLRRSLNFTFLLILLVAGIFWLPGSDWIWVIATLGIIAFPTYITLSSDLLNRPTRVRWQLHMIKVRDNLRIHRIQALSSLIVAPHQAYVHLDAILRTLYRLTISKKWLLEWSTASHVESESRHSLLGYVRQMTPAMLLAVGILTYTLYGHLSHIWVVTPLCILWLSSPVYVWYISRPLNKLHIALSQGERMSLRLYARRTWSYFERFVNVEHGWLPPDNYQEDPALSEAARTSPTNIGLALASNTSAYRLGYITLGMLLQRQLDSLQAVIRLERHKGHLFNWYATGSGIVLQPSYISTVDSGNLAASLITVKEAIKEAMAAKDIYKDFRVGLLDTLSSIDSIAQELRTQNVLNAIASEAVQTITRSMLRTLGRDSHKTSPISVEHVGLLMAEAEELSHVPLFQADRSLNRRTLENFHFWIQRPLVYLDNVLNELVSLTNHSQLDVHQYSCIELKSIWIDNAPDSIEKRLIDLWHSQADEIVGIAESLIDEMDFSFLYLKERGLFSIGYNLDIAQYDKGTYDLLASESRIASYVAIAKGDVPVEHWFRLSRRLTRINQDEMLLSWGGTMFEYLMPLLFMKSFDDTMMNSTCYNVVQWQKKYGHSRGYPWGSSESAYYFLNIDLHYQYRTFGVPGLGLKRGLADEYVIAPYASILSLMVEATDPIKNLKEIVDAGGLGIFGFYDAIDYTPAHLTEGATLKIVKNYMVHHHGMSLIAMDNVLNRESTRNSFHADARVKSCELLLQERIPKGTPIKEPHPIDAELEPSKNSSHQYAAEHMGINELDQTPPRLHTLSNGTFSTVVTHAGSGYAKTEGVVLNAWKADPTTDPLGMYFYVKDVESNEYWSAMHQPVKRKPDRYDTWFHNGKVVSSRVDHWIETTSEICVSPDHPIELRKLTFTNYSNRVRTLEITSYAEVVLNGAEHHHAHPAFSKLFVETEYMEPNHALLAKRRPRSSLESPMYLIHTSACSNQVVLGSPVGFETERGNFIGVGRSLCNPLAMTDGFTLKGSQGNVLDPIVSLRKQIILHPGEKAHLSFGLGFARSREAALHIADVYDSQLAVNRAFDLAAIYGSVELNHMGIRASQAHLYQRLSSYLLYGVPSFRADTQSLLVNRRKQADLWAYGVSGDFPLAVFRVNETSHVKHVKLLLKAHSFWRKRGIESELLIINEHTSGYLDEIQEAIQVAIDSSLERDVLDRRGGVFVYRAEKIHAEALTLLLTVAHVVWNKHLPILPKVPSQNETQSWYSDHSPNTYRPLTQLKTLEVVEDGTQDTRTTRLRFFNEYGGFSPDGTEYHLLIKTDPRTGIPKLPPAPWINVIANPSFGFTVSERGAGYTWSENSRENKLTSWSNDPVIDTHSEAFYIRDEVNMLYWSPSPGPAPAPTTYQVVHGFGYSSFTAEVNGLQHCLVQFAHSKLALKISKLTLRNTKLTTQRLSVFRYLDRVLGVDGSVSSRFVNQDVSSDGTTLFACNHYNNEFAGRTVFSTLINPLKGAMNGHTTDRSRFIGRNRSLDRPLAIESTKLLGNNIVPGEDPCAALQTYFELGPDESVTLLFLEGECSSRDAAADLLRVFSDVENVNAELESVHAFWKSVRSKVVVTTPDASLNILVNGWLMYQNLSSRMWARTGFYQAGGAYGFRDQLQDAMAALYADSLLCRDQLLLHAKQQFLEGDVLHWWHPPTGRGIRSRITDDRLWLPYVLDFYLTSTADTTILAEEISYIAARQLEPNEHEIYVHPGTLEQTSTLYEHCCRAIDVSLRFGANGLPLIGGGDWNDGMNRVGESGMGESVWLGFFLYDILVKFERICRTMNDSARADHYAVVASELRLKLNENGWDGSWYLRAFYDDGTPIGSSLNKECRIDAISQAWSIFSGAASKERGQQSLHAVEQHLVSEKGGFIRLLTPPFDKTASDPGYIKGYIPGVRENGGQYTHAALWTVKAFAAMGMGEKAVHYFNMINPINHSLDKSSADVYKVEPYVVAADVYGEAPLTGQGGWTWYTGSAGWMYRVALESILGLQYNGNVLLINPAISESWEGFTVDLLLDDNCTLYHIHILNPEKLQSGLLEGTVDGVEVRYSEAPARILLCKDKSQHDVRLNIIDSTKYSPI